MPNWKKVIVSGSAASLSSLVTSGNITGSGNLEVSGDISGSSATTGSFGRVEADTYSGDGSALGGVVSSDLLENAVYDSSSTTILNMTFIKTADGSNVICTNQT
jgi:hypothetical protein